MQTRYVRWSVLGAAMLMVAALVVAVAGAWPAGAAGTLLSQGRPAVASSVENATFPATAAVDGNTGTRWSSQFADPQ